MAYVADMEYSSLHPDACWQVVLGRGDGDFLYGVTTMGIYCRPSCPAPRPLQRNTRFFADAADARAAGFRPCRRCDPDGTRAALAAAAVADACAFIAQRDTVPALDVLARRAGYSRFHFLRMFHAHTGLTPRAYAEASRTARLRDALAAGFRVADAVLDAGYGSESRVYEQTGRLLGMTPGAARRGGKGEVIRTAAADTAFGRILVGATEKGVCSIGFDETEAELAARFPQARLQPDDPGLAEHLAAVLRFLQEPAAGLALPLDLRGTAFQQRVWQALCAIPPGETRSYAAVAAAVGAPRAVRAVASACARNAVALAVPCHRVVGTNGALCGYRWGVARKRALLETEKP